MIVLPLNLDHHGGKLLTLTHEIDASTQAARNLVSLFLTGDQPTQMAFGAFLPVAGFLFSLMTVDSAVAYWRGRGGAWKGRTLSRGAT